MKFDLMRCPKNLLSSLLMWVGRKEDISTPIIMYFVKKQMIALPYSILPYNS